MYKILILVVLAFLLLYFFWPRNNSHFNPNTREAKFYAQYFNELLELRPTMNDYLQLPGKEHLYSRYSDISPEWYTKALDFYTTKKREFLELMGDRELDFVGETFLYEVNDNIAQLTLPALRAFPVNQMFNPVLDYVEIINGSGAIYDLLTPIDYEQAMNKTKEFGKWVDNAIANMRVGIRQGYVLPRIIAETTIESMQDMLNNKQYVNPDVPAELAPEWNATMDTYFVKPVQKLITFMQNEYLPYTRNTIGFSSLPDGKNLYKYLVKHNVTTDVDIAQVHQLGLQEVARIQALKDQLGDVSRGNYTNDEVGRREIMEDYLQAQRDSDALTRKYFNEPPPQYHIKPIPKAKESTSPGAYYSSGDISGGKKGTFWLNLGNVGDLSKDTVMALTLHEGNPGHNYQITLANRNSDIPLFIRANNYSGYAEGWGLYAESLGDYKEPHSLLGRLNNEMLRAARLVVDTGIHYFNWSFARSFDYYKKYTDMSDDNIRIELLRYIAIPGQALSYKLGEFAIKDMLEGWDGDIKDFHSAVLANGAGPLEVVAKEVARMQN